VERQERGEEEKEGKKIKAGVIDPWRQEGGAIRKGKGKISFLSPSRHK